MIDNVTNEDRQLACRVRASARRILEEWEVAVVASIPANRALSRSALRNSLMSLLSDLADALEDGAAWHHRSAAEMPTALEHARQRFDLGQHGCGDLVEEYAELRRAVVRNTADALPHAAAGVRTVHAFIDACMKHSLTLFVELTLERDKKKVEQELLQTQGSRVGVEQERDANQVCASALQQERLLRDQVVAMVGHDMRAPLAAALLTARQLLTKIDGVPLGPERLKRIIQGIDRLGNMVADFLAADDLRSGQPAQIRVSICDLTEVFHAAYRDLGGVYGQRFVADIPDYFMAYADREALGGVLDKLAHNAVKYGSDDAPIVLRLEKQAGQAVLSVRNEGNPIDERQLPRLFEPRFRSEAADRSTRGGWGLGLASVKAVAEAHGGSVDVHSHPGDGTTFYVRIPITAACG